MEPKLLVTKASKLLLLTLTVMTPLPPLAPSLLPKPLWKTYPKRKGRSWVKGVCSAALFREALERLCPRADQNPSCRPSQARGELAAASRPPSSPLGWRWRRRGEVGRGGVRGSYLWLQSQPVACIPPTRNATWEPASPLETVWAERRSRRQSAEERYYQKWSVEGARGVFSNFLLVLFLVCELKKEEMSRSQDEPPHELENQFILRLPMEHASTVRKMVHSGSSSMKNKLKIDLFFLRVHWEDVNLNFFYFSSADTRRAVVEVDNVSLAAKLVDLPCVIGSLKTLDRKTFYKTADVSQMLVCTAGAALHSSSEEPVTSTDLKAIRKTEKQRQKKYTWKHGITPPLKNVRRRRFRKTTKKLPDFKQIEEMDLSEEKAIPAKHRVLNDITGIPSFPSLVQHIESPDVEKEVKRLLCSDAEAVSARWEVIADGDTKEIECQGSIPSYAIASGMSGYKQGPTLPEYYVLQEMRNDSSNNTEDDEEEEDYNEEEEEDYYDEDMERELQARFIEYGQYEAKEGTSSMVMEIQKHTQYTEKKLNEIQRRAQRQEELIRKVENLTLKNHLQSVLEQLKLQEEEKTEQLNYLQEKLNYFLKK
ncbi:hypothetical protein Celaphus_00009733 [Cervus elaphus hippelaphus]|uniref:TAFII55 protein conserved region domain-containing protein n=1 Tax=Cervus elaphus hippelaphus TaxID=46360 RepID=A0A212BZD2_CEREH|nr:hypothetical protein Celaphus_00009733 [Cervus elaphus hippelaphus]